MNPNFDDIIKNYQQFINICEASYGNRCIICAKYSNDFYITISGYDYFEDANKVIDNLKKDIEKTISNMYDSGKTLEYVEMPDNVIYENIIIDLNNGVKSKFETYGKVKNTNFNHRKFSCCERKLLAKFDNNISNLMLFDYIICKYEPCYMCYPFVKNLPNFYVYNDINIYKIIMPNNFIIAELSIDYKLLLELTGDNKKIDIGDNYLFVKEIIK